MKRLPDKGNRGPLLEPDLGGELVGKRLVAGPGPTGPCGLTTCRESHWGWVNCIPGGRQKRCPGRADPWHCRLVLGTWNVTSLAGNESELMREVERYQLDMVGLTSTHSTGSVTKLLERGWTLSFSGVAQGVRRQVGVGILTSPRLSAAVLEFSPVNERVASMRLQVAGGKALTVMYAYAKSTDHHLVVSWIRWRGKLPDRPGKPKCVVRVNWEWLGTWNLSGPCSEPPL